MQKTSLHQDSGRQACAQCSASFEITAEDLAFLEKLSPKIGGKILKIPPPTLCPECRRQRHITWRNERTLYQRTCDLCGKSIISIHETSALFPVYCNECWWSDRWNAQVFGCPYDPSRSFLAQMQELRAVVPRNALYLKNTVNCDYCNHSLDIRNCYLCVCVGYNSEDGYYSKWIIKSKNFCDCYQLIGCELQYESFYSNACYNCIVAERSEECRDSAFLYDCTGCSDCFCCWNLRHKRFCIENVQYTEKEYRQRRNAIDLGSYHVFQDSVARYRSLIAARAVRVSMFSRQCENVSGDFLIRCKNVHDSYDVEDGQDARFCYGCAGIRDCYDINEAAVDCELQYDAQSCDLSRRICFSHTSYYCSDGLYLDSCHSCRSCFGSVGLRNAQYCIFNHQYTKEEFETLVPKIIEQMRQDGEWGEFFPAEQSPFAYNETTAMEYFPLTEEEVLRRGLKWKNRTDEPPKVDRIIPAHQLPNAIDDIPDDILNWAIECEATGRPFRIIKQELDLYRAMRLPIPHLHPDERHRRRMALRNPRKLWQRKCAKCGKEIRTTYAPERPEIVYCEACYLAEVY